MCHDCQKEEVFATYKDGEFTKCQECFEKEPLLKNFQECLVFSRVTGYYSPTKNWNKGKQEEWKARKMYLA